MGLSPFALRRLPIRRHWSNPLWRSQRSVLRVIPAWLSPAMRVLSVGQEGKCAGEGKSHEGEDSVKTGLP
jgi:hypothetical protein